MKLYWEYMIRQFNSGLTYKFNYVCNLVSKILFVFSQYFIWKALMEKQTVETASGSIQFREMITYMLVSTFISTIINSDVILELNDKIKSGQIALDIVKPIDYKKLLFVNTVSKNLYNVIYLLLPTMIISIAIFGINIPSLGNGFVFIISVILATLINYMMCFCLGILGFWFSQLWIMNRLVYDLLALFSGKVIPLWFFPVMLLKVADCLPFKMIYTVPIFIYLEKYNNQEIVLMLFVQLIWLVILFVVSRLLWGRGMKKIVVQGG